MDALHRYDAEAGLRHTQIAVARLRRSETRAWAALHHEFTDALEAQITQLQSTLDWLKHEQT